MSAPNLDCMDHSDLTDFAVSTGHHPVVTARSIFSSRPKGYVTATHDLKHYAWNKATAMSCRKRGDIPAALIYERICDNIYNRLPAFARW